MKKVGKDRPKVRVYSRVCDGVAPLKGYTSLGHDRRRIYFTAPILAPSAELRKFAFWGRVKSNVDKPPHQRLQEAVLRYYYTAEEVARQVYDNGTYDTIPSKEFTKKVDDAYFQTLADEEDTNTTEQSHQKRLKTANVDEFRAYLREDEMVTRLLKMAKKLKMGKDERLMLIRNSGLYKDYFKWLDGKD